MTAISPARSMWLLAQLRLRRLLNVATTMRFGASKSTKRRVATGAKNRVGWLLPLLVTSSMGLSFLNIADHSLSNIQCHLNPASRCLAIGQHSTSASIRTDASKHSGVDVARRELEQTPFAMPVLVALTMQLTLLFLVSVLLPLGTREIAQAEWDLEWLVTLPLRRTVLIAARLFERTLANPTGAMTLLPLCGIVAWVSGYRWTAPFIALVGSLALLALAALVRTLIDTGLRLTLPPSQLRNLQAMASVFSLPFLYLAMALGMPSGGGFVLDLARAVPSWTVWTPPGLVLQSINAGVSLQALGLLLLLFVQVGMVLWVGTIVLRHQLRNGVVAAGAREAVSRGAAIKSNAGRQRFLLRSPIKRRELRLLARDRNFLVQSVLLPVVMVGSQLLLNGRWVSMSQLGTDATLMAATAFGIGSYMLMLSAFQTLNSEGQVLWMLYTFPRSIESVLKEKAQLWATLALLYPMLIFGVTVWSVPTPSLQTLALFVIALAGIPVYAVIAVALGVFACDPLAQDARTKVRVSYLYLYMLLASMYGYAIYTTVWTQRLVVIVLATVLAQALWQKARDELPFLLDPSAAPPARVSTADGMIAAMLFFVLQALGLVVFADSLKGSGGSAIVMVFGVAGALVYAIMRFVYWRAKTAGVPRLLGANWRQSTLAGLGGGIVASVLGSVYLHALQHTSMQTALPASKTVGLFNPQWLFLLAVVVAPLAEEFIFRGLIFGGLRRSMGLLPAMMASAALFSIIHPPVAMLPVFVLGLCTAFVYEHTKALLAPMLTHAIYNAVVLVLQLHFH